MRLGRDRSRSARRWSLLAPLLAVFCLAVFIAAESSSAASPIVPPGFRVEASNGYTVHGIGFDGTSQEHRDELLLLVEGRNSIVLYVAPAEVNETEGEGSIKADLGALGSIDLRFVPSGRAKTEAAACDSKPQRLDSGFYEGTISLEGEEGYMRANATRAPGELRVLESLVCAELTSVSYRRTAGGELVATRRSGATATQLTFSKRSPKSPATFEASIEERRGPISILRAISGRVPTGAFKYDVNRQRATVHPGSPFSGSATFNGAAPRKKRIHGSLNVDFPGHSNVPLTPLGTKAALVRATESTPNPFRLPRLAAPSTLP
ncbi:MAG TPA: hypothetical protein VMS60_07505 [Solirubrobacterales bacterium]|nr:hypothetical protein [Solirubrobacterales bacterium]